MRNAAHDMWDDFLLHRKRMRSVFLQLIIRAFDVYSFCENNIDIIIIFVQNESEKSTFFHINIDASVWKW